MRAVHFPPLPDRKPIGSQSGRLIRVATRRCLSSTLHLRSSIRVDCISRAAHRCRRSLNGGLRRQLICLALILNLLIWPGPNLIAQQIPVMASTSVEYTTVAARTISDFFKWLFSRSKTQRAGHLTSADRRARVARIRINPAKFVGYEGQQVVFTAFPTDASDEPAQGIRFDWSSSNPEKVKIDEAGRATFMQAGLAWITCSIGAARALVPVLVRQGRRPMQSDSDWRSDQNRLNADGASTSTTSWIPNLLDKLVPTAYGQG